jgi:hypothetical protein
MAKVLVNWGPTNDDSPVSLFVVFNTAHRSLYVLARDWRIAMSVAYTANHVYDPTPKIADTYGRHVDEVKSPHSSELEHHWRAIEAAIARRLEGTVHFSNGHVSVGHESID